MHLAAQAGVRYSIENPHSYIDSNIVGTLHILEGCRHHGVTHLVLCLVELRLRREYDDAVLDPPERRPSAGALRRNEESQRADGHTYSNLYNLPTTGLRFFTVYGPWGRPDMALFLFTKNILGGKPIDVFNFGKHKRDFTYVDDIVEGVVRTSDHTAEANPDWDPATPDPGTSAAPYRLYNIGNQQPVELMDYIGAIEDCLGRKAEMNLLPLQPGDVPDTWADTDALAADVGYQPGTPIEVGVRRFVEWYLDYYGDDLKRSA